MTPSAPEFVPPSDRFWALPRLDPDGRWIGGVASGAARELGIDVLLVRTALVILTLSAPIWTVLYVAAYLTLTAFDQNLRSGRPVASAPKGRDLAQRHIGFAMASIGLVSLSRMFNSLVPLGWLMPVGLVLMGATLAWSRGGRTAQHPMLRLGLGVSFVLTGVVVLVTSRTATGLTLRLGGLILLIAAGLAVLAGPWLYHTGRALNQERAARIRADEKGQIAAHLHDSVLQTLALIQKSADDPARTLQLARRQERQLRDWLYGPTEGSVGAVAFRTRLGTIVDEVEELHGAVIESVVVGDTVVDPAIERMLNAAREAMVNAAKHSGAPRIDVYAELGPQRAEIFVRDTGVGFDPDDVDELRRGISDSIRGRMERLGGWATITSEPGEGTEVELTLARPPEEAPPTGAGA